MCGRERVSGQRKRGKMGAGKVSCDREGDRARKKQLSSGGGGRGGQKSDKQKQRDQRGARGLKEKNPGKTHFVISEGEGVERERENHERKVCDEMSGKV